MNTTGKAVKAWGKLDVEAHHVKGLCTDKSPDSYDKLVELAWKYNLAAVDPNPSRKQLCRSIGVHVDDTDSMLAAVEQGGGAKTTASETLEQDLCGLSLKDLMDPVTHAMTSDYLHLNRPYHHERKERCNQFFNVETLQSLPSPNCPLTGHLIHSIYMAPGAERFRIAKCLSKYGIFSPRSPHISRTITIGGWDYQREDKTILEFDQGIKWANPTMMIQVLVPWARRTKVITVSATLNDTVTDVVTAVGDQLSLGDMSGASKVLVPFSVHGSDKTQLSWGAKLPTCQLQQGKMLLLQK